VSETFVVDPTLWVLPALLTPLPPREVRKNLKVVSSNGRVDASVYLVDGMDQSESRSVHTARTSSPSAARTTMYIESAGSANVTLRHITLGNNKRSPYFLHVVAGASATVYIPREFRGLLTLTSSVSQAVRVYGVLAKKATLLSEDGARRQYFVGDLPGSSDGEGTWGTWQGDEIMVVRETKHSYAGQYYAHNTERNRVDRDRVDRDRLQVSFVDDPIPIYEDMCICC